MFSQKVPRRSRLATVISKINFYLDKCTVHLEKNNYLQVSRTGCVPTCAFTTVTILRQWSGCVPPRHYMLLNRIVSIKCDV